MHWQEKSSPTPPITPGQYEWQLLWSPLRHRWLMGLSPTMAVPAATAISAVTAERTALLLPEDRQSSTGRMKPADGAPLLLGLGSQQRRAAVDGVGERERQQAVADCDHEQREHEREHDKSLLTGHGFSGSDAAMRIERASLRFARR